MSNKKDENALPDLLEETLELDDTSAEEIRVVKRKLVIVGVGSSANIHLLNKVVDNYPEILIDNEIVMLETSEQ